MIPVVIVGASGRMGRALLQALADSQDLKLHGAVDRADSVALGQDVGTMAGLRPCGVLLGSDLASALKGARVMIDFSDPAATAANVELCAQAGVAAFVGTTGQGAGIEAALQRAAAKVPVLLASNTSLGVTLLHELVRQVAAALPADFDIEITEAHHRHKKDAPSGTALTLGRAAAEGRGQRFEEVAKLSREGVAPRQEGEIGFSVIRAGDIVGDHAVMFAGTAERIILVHQATDRSLFARGALRGAAWLAVQPPGRYQMRDVIAVKTKT